jgi:3-oxoacyl-[acyl-carrier-protein] synthase III
MERDEKDIADGYDQAWEAHRDRLIVGNPYGMYLLDPYGIAGTGTNLTTNYWLFSDGAGAILKAPEPRDRVVLEV